MQAVSRGMKQTQVVFALLLIATASSQVAAQEKLEFTLDEVDASEAPRSARKPVDTSKEIQAALGAVRWGMSKAELLQLLKAQIRAEFEKRIKVERDIMRQDGLYQEANEQARRLTENYVSFDGQKTGWDVSPIGPEFTHGNRETMLVVTHKHSRELYFFIQGKLWKWYREVAPEAVDAADADEALSVISAPFGRGKPQAERVNDSKVAYEGTTWSDGTTRVTAMRRGADVCWIFEDVKTLQNLSVLRHSVQPVAAKARSQAVIDSILLSDAERH